MPAFEKGGIDTRRNQLAVYQQQGVAVDWLETHLDEEIRHADLRDEVRRQRAPELLARTAAAGRDSLRAIDVEAEVESARVQAEIDGERRAGVKLADVIDTARLRESDDVHELRALVDAAHRAGAGAEAVAIVRPRVQKLAGRALGMTRAIGGAPQVSSDAFAFLNELPQIGASTAKRRLEAVEGRRQARRRQLFAAAAVVHQDLPQAIQVAALKASRETSPSDSRFIVGPAWERTGR